MKTPRSHNEQRMAHCRGEVYRGCGVWPFSGLGSPLEPPFEPFIWSDITQWDLVVSGFDAPYQGRFVDRLKRLFLVARAWPLNLGATALQRKDPLNVVLFRHYAEDEVTGANVEE